MIVGMPVDYLSNTYSSWIPTEIVGVDAESGAVTLSCRTDRPIPLHEQKEVMRARTKPNQELHTADTQHSICFTHLWESVLPHS